MRNVFAYLAFSFFFVCGTALLGFYEMMCSLYLVCGDFMVYVVLYSANRMHLFLHENCQTFMSFLLLICGCKLLFGILYIVSVFG